jgi:hypothetical protein
MLAKKHIDQLKDITDFIQQHDRAMKKDQKQIKVFGTSDAAAIIYGDSEPNKLALLANWQKFNIKILRKRKNLLKIEYEKINAQIAEYDLL